MKRGHTNVARLAPLAVLLGAVAEPAASPAAAAPATPISFVACPIYRDTDAGRKSGCWLADEPRSGVRYDVSLGIAKPQLGRAVLIEGVVSSRASTPVATGREGAATAGATAATGGAGGGAAWCGGVVLEPVRTSTLAMSCPGALLPAEGFPGRRYVGDPATQLPQTWVPRGDPSLLEREQRFDIVFDFGSDFLNYQYSELLLDAAARLANRAQVREVRITGYATTAPLRLSDNILREPAALARQRAEQVAEALRRLDVDPNTIRVQWKQNAVALDQPLAEASRRRVEILLRP